VDCYVRLRKASKGDDDTDQSHTYTSARTLLGILRLSQALARLRLSDAVDIHDVDEALRLMDCSKQSLVEEDDDAQGKHDRSTASEIFRIIKKLAAAGTAKETAKGNKKSQRRRRLGRGPGGQRDMDVDDEPEDSDDDEEGFGQAHSLVEIRARVLRAGFSEAELMNAITQVSPHSLLLESQRIGPNCSTVRAS